MFITPKIESLAMRKFAAKLPWSPQGHHMTLSPSPGLFPLNSNQGLATELEVEKIPRLSVTQSCWRERAIPPLGLASSALAVGVQAWSIMLFPVLWEEYSGFGFTLHINLYISKKECKFCALVLF